VSDQEAAQVEAGLDEGLRDDAKDEVADVARRGRSVRAFECPVRRPGLQCNKCPVQQAAQDQQPGWTETHWKRASARRRRGYRGIAEEEEVHDGERELVGFDDVAGEPEQGASSCRSWNGEDRRRAEHEEQQRAAFAAMIKAQQEQSDVMRQQSAALAANTNALKIMMEKFMKTNNNK